MELNVLLLVELALLKMEMKTALNAYVCKDIFSISMVILAYNNAKQENS